MDLLAMTSTNDRFLPLFQQEQIRIQDLLSRLTTGQFLTQSKFTCRLGFFG